MTQRDPEADVEALSLLHEMFSLRDQRPYWLGTGRRGDGSSGLSPSFRARPERSQTNTSSLTGCHESIHRPDVAFRSPLNSAPSRIN